MTGIRNNIEKNDMSSGGEVNSNVQKTHTPPTMTDCFSAIAKVETNGNPRIGEAGEIGTYQIMECYWIDSKILGEYQQCWDDKYARRVMLAYWARYCPVALKDMDFEVLARIHNKGPQGANKDASKKYWEKVKSHLTPSEK